MKRHRVFIAILVALFATPANSQRLRLVPQLGHQSEIASVTFSPDGKTLATGSWDGKAKLDTIHLNMIAKVRSVISNILVSSNLLVYSEKQK